MSDAALIAISAIGAIGIVASIRALLWAGIEDGWFGEDHQLSKLSDWLD